jgi:hypothetical protein
MRLTEGKIQMTSITLNRTELTEYETAILHQVKQNVRSHSIAVGAFVSRYGTEANLAEAAELFLRLNQALTADSEIRTEAIQYGMSMANFGAGDQNASQAYRLRCEFLKMLYSSAIAERVGE